MSDREPVQPLVRYLDVWRVVPWHVGRYVVLTEDGSRILGTWDGIEFHEDWSGLVCRASDYDSPVRRAPWRRVADPGGGR